MSGVDASIHAVGDWVVAVDYVVYVGNWNAAVLTALATDGGYIRLWVSECLCRGMVYARPELRFAQKDKESSRRATEEEVVSVEKEVIDAFEVEVDSGRVGEVLWDSCRLIGQYVDRHYAP